MFVAFEPIIWLLWVFVSSFVPGAILSLSLFKKDDYLTFTEKAFLGFAIGLIVLPLIPFLLYFIAGVNYSFDIAVLSTTIVYAVAIGFFVKNKSYENMALPDVSKIQINKAAVSSLVILIAVIAFIIRMAPYSPVFYELDPYYYTYSPYQLLTLGENPQNDQTAWYPVETTSHRIVPALSYLEAIWYSLYTQGGAVDNLLLAIIASMYPPLMAALAFFFLYLFISSSYKREWALVGAGIASFAPVLIYKLFSGEQEVQSYAFFAIAFFLAMYSFMVKKKDIRFAILAGIAFAAISLGSSSQILAVAFMLLFVVIHSLILFFKKTSPEDIRQFILHNGIIFVLGPLLGTGIKSLFYSDSFYFGLAIPSAMALIFAGVIYVLRRMSSLSKELAYFGLINIVCLLILVFTPVGGYVKQIGESGFGVATFNSALDRTIAEQGTTGELLSSQIGFVAADYPKGIDVLFGWISWLVNGIFGLSVKFLNAVLGTDVAYQQNSNNFVFLWIFLFVISLAYSLYKFVSGKERESLVMLFAVVVLLPLIVGLIKAKYTIYAAFFIAVAIAMVLGESEDFIQKVILPGENNPGREQLYYAFIGIGAILVLFQFMHGSYAHAILASSLQPRFQDDPMALQAKFSSWCQKYNDADLCDASSDPMEYASRGTDYQYNSKLCQLSLVSDPQNPSQAEQIAINIRCLRLPSYWVNSMEWIRYNVEQDARIISWWDYGHWINYFGLHNTVLRNEHSSHLMIGEVAHAYLDGTPEDLISLMDAYDSEYALFDNELIMGGSQLGGKYGALNYLSCARDNVTDVKSSPGESECEIDHLWETIIVPATGEYARSCVVSESTGKTGVVAYHVNLLRQGGSIPLQFYPEYCTGENVNTGDNLLVCQNYILLEPAYCIANATLANGQSIYATYYLDQRYPNGDLRLSKGFLSFPYSVPATHHLGDAIMFTMLYTDDVAWFENGETVSGYADRKGKFYDSNLYRALFLNDLPGFEQVYASSDNNVKIYKISR